MKIGKRHLSQILLNAAMLVFFGVLFITGTFLDESISKTLFSPGIMPVELITSTGVYPFLQHLCFFQVFFLNVLLIT